MQWSEFSFVLKPTSHGGVGGVGVFAVHDISAGTVLFRPEINIVRTFKIKDVPPEFLKYCIYINEEECIGPQQFDRMEIGWFINHSATPNISAQGCPKREGGQRRFWAIRDIKAGEEIVMDYNELEEPESLKEDYYRPSHDNT